MIDRQKPERFFNKPSISGCLLSINLKKLLFIGCLLVNTSKMRKMRNLKAAAAGSRDIDSA
ncbi:MAG: hypothetical protein NTY50_14290 [Methylobacter sp.]|nr:hypothetical protein [Methylobacter sp.]